MLKFHQNFSRKTCEIYLISKYSVVPSKAKTNTPRAFPMYVHLIESMYSLVIYENFIFSRQETKITSKLTKISPFAKKHQSFSLPIFLMNIDGPTKINENRRLGTLDEHSELLLSLSVKKHRLS